MRKLYRVTLKGMFSNNSSSPVYGVSYVVADNPSEAYNVVQNDLVQRDIGFDHQRALDKVELIAEDTEYPDCRTRLYVWT